jgi:hypothetical protein
VTEPWAPRRRGYPISGVTVAAIDEMEPIYDGLASSSRD